ncbi:MAG: adenylate kinase [Patescibacteria group bacterium]|jgi:adenylate kinase
MLNLIIFGPPGAGKGTQAELIAKQFKLAHLSSGELLRQELKKGELGRRIKKYQDLGQLVPDSLIIEMIEKTAKKKIKGAGFIFDGYPRTIKQARTLDKFLKNNRTKLNLIINLKLSEAEALKRMMLRAKTSGRSDDNAKTIKNRFKVYRNQTKPLLTYYQKQKKIVNIDGRPPIEPIFQNITKILKTRA